MPSCTAIGMPTASLSASSHIISEGIYFSIQEIEISVRLVTGKQG
jgi:hypothetical protein